MSWCTAGVWGGRGFVWFGMVGGWMAACCVRGLGQRSRDSEACAACAGGCRQLAVGRSRSAGKADVRCNAPWFWLQTSQLYCTLYSCTAVLSSYCTSPSAGFSAGGNSVGALNYRPNERVVPWGRGTAPHGRWHMGRSHVGSGGGNSSAGGMGATGGRWSMAMAGCENAGEGWRVFHGHGEGRECRLTESSPGATCIATFPMYINGMCLLLMKHRVKLLKPSHKERSLSALHSFCPVACSLILSRRSP